MALQSGTASAQVRIKDVVDVQGVRENLLVGYGLVVGLNGSGDNIANSAFTEQSMIGMLERLGVNIRGETFKPKNVAAVMVTATLPAFVRQGSRIDITVSAIGDAKSLQGGTLLVTPLMGADGEVYAVSQGPVAIAGFSAEGDSESVTKGVPTNGRIAGGAVIEREVPFELGSMSSIRLALRNPDFTTADRIAQAINGRLGGGAAFASDPATVQVTVPVAYAGNVARLITDVEQLHIVPDQVSRVVIDESSGTIVMGDSVRISRVAISQGNLTVRITETPQVSQPAPFSNTGDTTVVPRTSVDVVEDGTQKIAVLDSGASLEELVSGLNALGVSPRDMIAILQAIKAAGALQAEIDVMWQMNDLAATNPIAAEQGYSRTSGTNLDQKAREAAQEFEALFLGQMLAEMYASVETNGLFGGGFAERTYQTLLEQEVGKAIAATQGIGIADAVYDEILKIQGLAK